MLSTSQKLGIISILPKADKSREFLKNWRPISLLNVSYKLLSSCIANRIKQVLQHIIHENQRGFMKGRYIGENTRIVYDIIQISNKHKIPGMILLVVFEKAFDSVSWSFMYKALHFFNFGPDIIRWVKTLYADAKLCVIQNGIFSEFFNIGRGCRQGDPVSPYLFNICVEIMGILIRQNNNIKGIHIVKEFCLFQYADDTILFLDGTEKSLKSALDLLFQFSKFSGLKPNIGKTKAIWIGSMAESEDTICNNYNLQWSNGEFTVLGIKFNSSLSQMTEANFDNKLSQIVKEINSWSKRQLTPFGKITIIKSLLLPKLAHLFINLPKLPEKWMKNLEQVFFKFIWNDKTDKISRSQAVQDYPDGGLKMVHLESYVKSLKVTWLRRILLSSPTSSLITIFNETCQCELSSLLQFGPEYPKQLAKKCNNLYI